MSDITLKIGAMEYAGWKSLSMEGGIEQCSGAFNLFVSDRWADNSEPRLIYPGDACSLLLNDQVVITGYIDDVKPMIDKQQHGIRVVGRDSTMDLIDCSAVYKSGQWKRVTLDRIVRDIATPFGIEVVVLADVGAVFDSFNIEEGEKAFETMDRAARMRGVLLMSDGQGRLLLATPTQTAPTTSLVEGDNILHGEVLYSWKERYSQITVKGQGKGNATEFGEAVAHGSATVTDPSITRYRPLVIISEHHGKGPTFKKRAEWERNIRRGRGTRARIVVQGWTDREGKVWRANTLVSVVSPTLGIMEDLLIVKCDYSLGDQDGTLTGMQLAHPSAFEILEGVKATRLGRKASGSNGMEVNKKEARDRAKKKRGDGEIVTFETGTSSGQSK